MAIELTGPQQQALDAQQEQPLRVVDPRTLAAYVLLPAPLYDRVRELLDQEEDRALREAWQQTAATARRNWLSDNPVSRLTARG